MKEVLAQLKQKYLTKETIRELKSRFLNRTTIAAIAAYIIAQLLAHNVIHTQQLASGIQDIINGVLNLLVLLGVLNNPSSK